MATITRHSCDICKGEAKHLQQTIQVVLLTEQTEGRSTTPHFSMETMDLCDICLKTIIDNHPITGTGAQGYNTFKL